MIDIRIRNSTEIQSEIFSNKERIKQLVGKLQLLKEISGEKQ